MKVFVILSFLFLSQVSGRTFAQRITLAETNAPLESVLNKIKAQSGRDVFFIYKDIQQSGPISVNVRDVSLEEALGRIFQGQPLTYALESNTIIVKRKPNAQRAEQRQTQVSGQVVDGEGVALPGVSVKVKGSNLGGVTDAQGNYAILLPSPQEVLVFSFVGYATQELATGAGTLNVTLQSTAQTLDDVVVVGFGTQKKVNVTGSVSSVNMADLRTPVPNLSNALAGRVAGVISVQSSGEPGYDNSTFTIRGIGTFTGNTSPLVIVDGVQRDDVNSSYGGAFNNIDPEDVSSISLLKDASSTAMYGAKGANGVLIITTKRGVAGKPRISLKTETGRTGFTQTPEMLSGVQYMELLNEARRNMGLTANYSDERIAKTASGLDPYVYPDVNWVDQVYKKSSALTNANLNIHGGGEAARYYVSASFYNQQGPYRVGNQDGYNPNLDFKRYDFRTNVDVNVTPTTLLQLNLAAMLVNSRYPGIPSANLWYLSFATTPVAFPVRYPDGRWAGPIANGGNNPLNEVQNNGYTDEFRPSVQSVFTVNQRLDAIAQGLSSYVRFSFDSYGQFYNQRYGINDLWQANGRDGNGDLTFTQTRVGQQFLDYAQTSNGERIMYLEGNLNYDRLFGKHEVGGMLLYNMRNRLFSTAGNVIGSIPFRNQSVAGKVTYGFDDRYLLEVNVGYTGSENFERGRKFGLFPSVSGGWVISNEPFFAPLRKAFTLLKLRGSYGVVGNDNIGTGQRFPYLTQIAGGNGTGFGLNGTWHGGLTESQIGVENLTWEKAYKGGIGLEVGLYDKLTLIVDGFKERREDILIQRLSISSIAGYSGADILANIGEMSNGGMDASLEYTDQIGQVGLRLFGNTTYSRNKIIASDEPLRRYGYQQITGTRFGEFTGYISEGFFTDATDIGSRPEQKFGVVAPGDIRYRNLNPGDDEAIDAYDFTYLGKSWFPSWMYGAGFGVSYKGVDLSVFFQGVADVGLMANGSWIDRGGIGVSGVGIIPFSGNGQYPNNVLAAALDRWTPEDPRQDAYYPRLTMASLNDNNYLSSTHWLKNGSYVRLKQASLGYTFPSAPLRRLGCNVLYLYVSGNNLLTFSKFKLWDPELGSDGAKYPITRMATVGIRAQF